MRNEGSGGEKRRAKDRDKACENICRGRGRKRASESAGEKGAEGHRTGGERGGRQVERSITSGPGVVTLKRVNGQEPNFPPTYFFSLYHQRLSIFFLLWKSLPTSSSPPQFIAVFLLSLFNNTFTSLGLLTPCYISALPGKC